jgi:outer membrane protein W
MTGKFLVLVLFLCTAVVLGQSGDKYISIGINGVYTTNARDYLNPNSSDPVIRNHAFELSGILNPGIDIRYRISDEIILGLGTEYMRSTSEGPNLTAFVGNSTVTINVKDGFLLIPIELSGYYILPFSTEKFKFLMGGGVGYYYGNHIREFGNVSVSTVKRDFAYGIHVSVSMDYLLLDYLTIHSEMKFRDPQFKVENAYNRLEGDYNNQKVMLPQRTFYSKEDVNGITFILGLSFLF